MSTPIVTQTAQAVNPLPERDAVATLRRWASQRNASYADLRDAVQVHNNTFIHESPWGTALFEAAELLAGAERIAVAVAYAAAEVLAVRIHWTASLRDRVTHKYHFATASHQARRVKSCKICARLGRLCHIHAKRQAVTK